MDWITSLKDTAKNCIQRGDNGQATDKIDDARIKIAELDQVLHYYCLVFFKCLN